MKGLPAAELKIILYIIRSILPKSKAWVFGSRAGASFKAASDIDLCLDSGKKISLDKMAELRAAFEDSDLPYRVDLVDRQTATADFKKIIDKSAVKIA